LKALIRIRERMNISPPDPNQSVKKSKKKKG
jgi:hypothetical protein